MGNWSARVGAVKPSEFKWPQAGSQRTGESDVVRDAATQEAQRIRKRQGQAGTIVTGLAGLAGPAMVLKQTLGGA